MKRIMSSHLSLKRVLIFFSILSILLHTSINKCISEYIFTGDLKPAHVVSTFDKDKKDLRNLKSNNRAVSILPNIPKLFECACVTN